MVSINYENLPAPIGFAINVDELDLWEYDRDPEDPDQSTPRFNFAFSTPTLDVVLVELPSGTTMPWHTHEPHTAQVYWLLDGQVRANYKDNEGEVHSYEADAADEQLIYLPAGAYNQIESIGDETLRFLSFKEGGGEINGRLEHLFGDTSQHYDPEENNLSPGLDIIPTRGHIFDKQENAIEKY